tara:strand:- start:524 stop:820 length:297 start_codon:yes stop_codon:yes gene_type:complete
MSSEYHKKLVEAVGSSFYYYTNHKNFDLTKSDQTDFEAFAFGWIKKYRGDWDIYSERSPYVCNTFRPCVDQLVARIINATEDEIDRKVNERLREHIDK